MTQTDELSDNYFVKLINKRKINLDDETQQLNLFMQVENIPNTARIPTNGIQKLYHDLGLHELEAMFQFARIQWVLGDYAFGVPTILPWEKWYDTLCDLIIPHEGIRLVDLVELAVGKKHAQKAIQWLLFATYPELFGPDHPPCIEPISSPEQLEQNREQDRAHDLFFPQLNRVGQVYITRSSNHYDMVIQFESVDEFLSSLGLLNMIPVWRLMYHRFPPCVNIFDPLYDSSSNRD